MNYSAGKSKLKTIVLLWHLLDAYTIPDPIPSTLCMIAFKPSNYCMLSFLNLFSDEGTEMYLVLETAQAANSGGAIWNQSSSRTCIHYACQLCPSLAKSVVCFCVLYLCRKIRWNSPCRLNLKPKFMDSEYCWPGNQW